jgi:hypothetical protein
VWVAEATKVSAREWTLHNKDFNGVQHNGDTLTFTFIGHAGTSDISPTIQATIEVREVHVIWKRRLNLKNPYSNKDTYL